MLNTSMRRVRWIIRPELKPGRSIEQLFTAIRPVISEKCDLEVVTLPGGGDLKKDAIKQYSYIRNLKMDDKTLTHITGDVHYISSWVKGRQIHTIHDLESILSGNRVAQALKKKLWIEACLKNSVSVSVVSEYTKSRLLVEWPQHKSKIRVIPNPVLIEQKGDKLKMEPEFVHILSVGTKKNKNLETVLRVLKNLNLRCKWHVVGNLKESFTRQIRESGIPYSNYCGISNFELSSLYKSCDLLLFPSLFEGFGLPIIEAQAHGLPVITSNTASMPEVSGNAAVLVNPTDEIEMGQVILKLKHDKKIVDDLVKSGFLNAEKYKLQSVANQYLNWYETI